jgi:NitT/TauT family transport system substrate-binding protein
LIVVLTTLVVAGVVVIIVFRPFGSGGAEGKVRVGYLPIAADLPLFVAAEQGYFTKRGIDVETIRFDSSPLMGTAFVNNDVDAVASIATTVALSTESRDPGRFRIFMVDANTPASPLSGMLTMPASGVKTIGDLKGKKVGIFPGSNAALVFGLVLKKHGLDPAKDITLIELPAASQMQALTGGQIDALCTWEPITTQAVLDYKAVNFHPAAVEREVINPYNAGVWLLSQKYMEQHPETSRKFIEALEEALDFMRKDPEEAKKALLRYTSIAPHVAHKMEITSFWKLNEVDPAVFQRFADIVKEGGLINKKIDAPALLLDRKTLTNPRGASLWRPLKRPEFTERRQCCAGPRLRRDLPTRGMTWSEKMKIAA